jgi:hypothetical protein
VNAKGLKLLHDSSVGVGELACVSRKGRSHAIEVGAKIFTA